VRPSTLPWKGAASEVQTCATSARRGAIRPPAQQIAVAASSEPS
jgi:hypothetical protein